MGTYSSCVSDLQAAISSAVNIQNLNSDLVAVQTSIENDVSGLCANLSGLVGTVSAGFSSYVPKLKSMLENWDHTSVSDVDAIVSQISAGAKKVQDSIASLISQANNAYTECVSCNNKVQDLISQTKADIDAENATLQADQQDLENLQTKLDQYNDAAAEGASCIAILALLDQAQAAVDADNSQISSLNTTISQQKSFLGSCQDVSEKLNSVIQQIGFVKNDLDTVSDDIANITNDLKISDSSVLNLGLTAVASSLDTLLDDAS